MRPVMRRLLLPDVRVLYYTVLVFWSLLSLYSGLFFGLKGERLQLFTKVWLFVPALFGAYLLYGYVRLSVLFLKEHRDPSMGIVKQAIKDKGYHSLFAKIGGIASSFAFAVMYCAKGFMLGSGFYWFLAEFYLVAAMVKLYLNTIAETPFSRNDRKSYIIVYAVSVLMSVAIAGATFYVVFFDGIFEKSVYLIGVIGAFTAYKIVSASAAFHRSRKVASRHNLAKSLVALIAALFSIYTFAVALVILVFDDPSLKQFAYLGFGSAAASFVLTIWGLVNTIKEYKRQPRVVEPADIA